MKFIQVNSHCLVAMLNNEPVSAISIGLTSDYDGYELTYNLPSGGNSQKSIAVCKMGELEKKIRNLKRVISRAYSK